MFQRRLREMETDCSDFEDLSDEDRDGWHDGPVAVAFIAVLPLAFAVGMIFAAYWLVR